jgi:hypothetical protein
MKNSVKVGLNTFQGPEKERYYLNLKCPHRLELQMCVPQVLKVSSTCFSLDCTILGGSGTFRKWGLASRSETARATFEGCSLGPAFDLLSPWSPTPLQFSISQPYTHVITNPSIPPPP